MISSYYLDKSIAEFKMPYRKFNVIVITGVNVQAKLLMSAKSSVVEVCSKKNKEKCKAQGKNCVNK